MTSLRTLVALVLVCSWTSASLAQSRTPRIGLLSTATDSARPLLPQRVAFLDGLRALGYVEGQTIGIERRFAGGDNDRIPEFARDLVRLHVDVLVVTASREIQAARQATTTIPTVTIVAPDLVEAGFVTSLARPDGNVTGLTFSTAGLGGKYVELLRAALPASTRVAVVAGRAQPASLQKEMQDAARSQHVSLARLPFVKGGEFEPIFSQARREGVGGLIMPIDALTNLHRQRIVDLAARYRPPAIYTTREFVDIGGLMAYGPSFVDLFRRAPTFIDKILKGVRPADLPVEQPTRFEFLINLKTAMALGLTIPPTLLARADEVLQ
jgi:putative tryptophan/tyrosine transport system substrate-binding protein